MCLSVIYISLFCFKQKTAYEMRISDWSSDVCSSDLDAGFWRKAECHAFGPRAQTPFDFFAVEEIVLSHGTCGLKKGTADQHGSTRDVVDAGLDGVRIDRIR